MRGSCTVLRLGLEAQDDQGDDEYQDGHHGGNRGGITDAVLLECCTINQETGHQGGITGSSPGGHVHQVKNAQGCDDGSDERHTHLRPQAGQSDVE